MFGRKAISEPFQFLDPGPLVDGELRLVPPAPQWVDDVLAACHSPETLRLAPEHAHTTRDQLTSYLQTHPSGHQSADPAYGVVPAYHFWMQLIEADGQLRSMAGGIGLRVGQNQDLQRYSGHIGYHVYPPARGRHFAERACRLLLPLARLHRLGRLWITCNPDNIPSRRTCQRLGAILVEIVPVPPRHVLYLRGDREKCRFRLDLE